MLTITIKKQNILRVLFYPVALFLIFLGINSLQSPSPAYACSYINFNCSGGCCVNGAWFYGTMNGYYESCSCLGGSGWCSCNPCSCGSWTSRYCGYSTCTSSQMGQTRTCTPSGCSSELRCLTDSCGSWSNSSCGGGTCTSTQMLQTRTCTYDCYATSQCINDSCGSWSNTSCGGGTCSSTQMQQTRSCTYNCAATSQCLNDSCGSWSNTTCGGGSCADNRMQQTRTCTYNCESTVQCVVQTQCNQYTVTHDADGGDCDDSTLVYYDANVDGPTSCSKTDYDLTGYTLVSGTCNTSFNSTTGDCYGVRSDVTIEAEWTLSNSVPNPPQSPLTDGLVNPSDLQNITPEFSAIYDDDDLDDTSSYYEVEVNTASDFSGTVMWDSGKQSMTQTNEGARSPNITYNGTTLTYNGQTYYWRIKFWDAADASSDWSTANFTMDIPTSSYYEIEVNTSSDFTGTVMWDSGKTAMTETTAGQRSPTLTYNGDPLAGGVTYYWRIRFWDMNDSVSDWSDPAQFEINRTPTAPTVLLTEGETNPIKVYDTTPEFSAIYNDSDTGDTAGYYQIQVNTQNDFNGTSMWDSTKTAMTSTSAGTRSPDISYAGTTLSESTTYYWRIKFWDSNDHESPWSSTASFIMSGPPTASNLQIIGTTSPTQVLFDIYFSALYTDPNSDDSTNYEIEVNTTSNFTGTVMWDSNKTSATISSGSRSSDIYYDGTTLNYDGTTYYVRMRFWDTDDNVSDWTTDQFTDTLKSFRFNGLQMGGVQLN